MNAAARRVPLLMLAASLAILAVAPASVAQSPAALARLRHPRATSASSSRSCRRPRTSVGFTDWGRIKASVRAPRTSPGASPIDDKVAVGMSTAKGEALASGFGLAHLRDHYATWAFDAMDLDWEATIQGDGPPLFVLRFRDGFDLAPVAALFDAARLLDDRRCPAATIRSHEMVLHEDWLHEHRVRDPQHRIPRRRPDAGAVGRRRPGPGCRRPPRHVPGMTRRSTRRRPRSTAHPRRCSCPGSGTCLGFTPLPIDIGDPLASPDLSLPHRRSASVRGAGHRLWAPRLVTHRSHQLRLRRPATAPADLAGPPRAGPDRHQPASSAARTARCCSRSSRSHVDGANADPGRGAPRGACRGACSTWSSPGT